MGSVLVAAGGTGGHVHPALALAGVLRDRGHDVAFCGGDRMEARLVPEAGFSLHRLPVRGLPRSISLDSLRAGTALLRSIAGARRLLRDLAPDVVVGMGGYPSLAPALVAEWTGRPVVLHEQNARLVLAHRLALRRARVLALSLPLVGGSPRRRPLVVETGNPLRPEIRQLAASGREASREAARGRLGLGAEATVVLVFGGSQGARALNEAVPMAGRRWPRSVEVLHLAGAGHGAGVEEAWRGSDTRVVVREYLAEMEDAYAATDLVVCRSGASTIAELTALGLSSVLVPIPHSTGRVQEANARVLERVGGATVVPEGERFVERLGAAMGELLEAPGHRREMAEAVARFARPDAADRLADVVERALRGDGNRRDA